MKFIVSARAFWMLMEKSRDTLPDDEDYFEMAVENKKLHFGGISELDVESNTDGKIDLSRKQFKRLRKVVRALEDQPIVLSVQNRTLHIHNICF